MTRTAWTSSFRAACLGALLTFWAGSSAEGQMFGSRQVGRTLTPRSRPGVSGETGMVRNQRFVRGNRSAGEFVGSDRGDASRFVGTQQAGAGTAVRSAVAGIQAAGDESNQVNRPARRLAANEPYPPRLSVAFDYDVESSDRIARSLQRRYELQDLPIEVSVEDRTAILRGVVTSEEQRTLAELLAGFEAGISFVQNELTVDRSPATAAPPPPPPLPLNSLPAPLDPMPDPTSDPLLAPPSPDAPPQPPLPPTIP